MEDEFIDTLTPAGSLELPQEGKGVITVLKDAMNQ